MKRSTGLALCGQCTLKFNQLLVSGFAIITLSAEITLHSWDEFVLNEGTRSWILHSHITDKCLWRIMTFEEIPLTYSTNSTVNTCTCHSESLTHRARNIERAFPCIHHFWLPYPLEAEKKMSNPSENSQHSLTKRLHHSSSLDKELEKKFMIFSKDKWTSDMKKLSIYLLLAQPACHRSGDPKVAVQGGGQESCWATLAAGLSMTPFPRGPPRKTPPSKQDQWQQNCLLGSEKTLIMCTEGEAVVWQPSLSPRVKHKNTSRWQREHSLKRIPS